MTVSFALLFFIFIPLLFSNFLQHFSLRFVLWREGKIPLHFVRFLDRMSDQLVLEDNRLFKKHPNGRLEKMRGATWRFRHKILQDYFAGLETGE